ncbi:MAG: SIS domain-containing protein, partial [Pseudobutyrivibrio sp.]|nr:SIS domain-containing protein [Pseudobutyrivibrio sp.]
SLLVARDFYLKLIRIGKMVNISDDLHSQILYSSTMTKDDLAVVISYSGLTEEMITCAQNAKEKGAKVIAITRSSGSKLGRYADVILEVAATELIVRSGAMSSRISQLNMIDILYVSYVNRHYDELYSSFAKTQIKKEDK